MAHNIFGVRFLGRREPAWHGLGKVFTEPLSATEAIEEAGVDFQIAKVPLFAQVSEGAYIPTEQFAVVREPVHDDRQHRVLAVVGKEWTPIQAAELGKILDPLTQRWPVETVGALGYGEKVFLTLDAGEGKIAGEPHRMFYLVTDYRTGDGALTIAFTPVRVVCQNTLTAGLASARVRADLPHVRTIKADAEWYTSLMAQMVRSQEEAIAAMDSLAAKKVTDDQAMAIIQAAYPKASMPRRLSLSEGVTPDDLGPAAYRELLREREGLEKRLQERMDRVAQLRGAAWERYEAFNGSFPDLARTAWGAWQAVVETEDYRRGRSPEASSLFGYRAEAKQRAFHVALAL